jgi:hypothetical protein
MLLETAANTMQSIGTASGLFAQAGHRSTEGPGEPRATDLYDLFPGAHYAVTFSISRSCTLPRDEPSDYMETIVGQVVRIPENTDEEEPVGNFEGYRLRRDLAADESVPFLDIADGFTQETYEYLLEVFDEDGELLPHVARALGNDEPPWGPMLMAHKLELDPKCRGFGLGYAVINSFIETFEPGAWIVIARAAPINPRDIDPTELGTLSHQRWRRQGVAKLRRYWQRLGFVPISSKSDLLLMNLSMKRPPLIEVIRRSRAKSG